MYKGEQVEQLVFHLETITLGGTCGYGFRDDTLYLVFAHPSENQPDRWETHLCAGNEIEPSDEILAVMNAISQEDDDLDQTVRPHVIGVVIGVGALLTLLIANFVINNKKSKHDPITVSYTHLTLPTKRIV